MTRPNQPPGRRHSAPLLPSADVTVYTRAGEERIERRTLALDAENQFHFHGRELIAEGRGGVDVA